MTTNDIDWLAFAYLLNELSPAEREAFELRLADDQPAREALASAVDLSQAIVAAETLPVTLAGASKQRSSAQWSTAWTVATAASLLAVAVGIGAVGMFGRQKTADNADLAAAWSEARSQWEAQSSKDGLSTDIASVDQAEQNADADSIAMTSDWASADIETPSWMTAAVLAQDESAESTEDLPADADAPNATES